MKTQYPSKESVEAFHVSTAVVIGCSKGSSPRVAAWTLRLSQLLFVTAKAGFSGNSTLYNRKK